MIIIKIERRMGAMGNWMGWGEIVPLLEFITQLNELYLTFGNSDPS